MENPQPTNPHETDREAANGPRLVRIFLAIETPATAREALAEAQRALQRRGHLPARWTHPDDAHLTLLFFGNVLATHVPAIAAAMAPICARHAPFLLRLDGLGAFPSLDTPRVIWLGVLGQRDALMALHADIAAVMHDVEGVVADSKPFHPHLTLARIEAGRNRASTSAVAAALTRPLPVPSVAWDVSRVVLMRTMPGGGRGSARYTVLHAFPLEATTNFLGA